jgi:hypothetical protein
MNLYNYIANSNPDAANRICEKYGYYQVSSTDELAYVLNNIVATEGEEPFKEIMEIHPDKEVILEFFEKKNEEKPIEMDKKQKDCSCMMNADGQTNQINQGFANQTNIIILVAAMIVSISIISMKK